MIQKSLMLQDEQSAFVSFRYDPDMVKKIKTIEKRTYIPDTKEWEVPISAIETLKQLFPDQQIKIETKEENEFSIPSDFEFKSTLMPHQVEMIQYGLNNQHFIIGDDQGLGKTCESLAYTLLMKELEQIQHVLIICGVNGLKDNWAEEIEKHTYEKKLILGARYTKKGTLKAIRNEDKIEDIKNLDQISDVYYLITNYESFRNQEFADEMIRAVTLKKIGIIIFDEIHKCKNPTMQAAKNILKLRAPHRIGLSGTMIINSPLDAYMALSWFGFETRNYYHFKATYTRSKMVTKKEPDENGVHQQVKIFIGYQKIEEIQQKLDHCMIRRLKKDVLNLPPKIHKNVYCEMTDTQWKLYHQIESEITNEYSRIKEISNPLVKLSQLRQVTIDPSLVSDVKAESGKYQKMIDLIEEATSNGSKVIVYSEFAEAVKNAANFLRKYHPAIVTGDVRHPQEEIQRFKKHEQCKVILGTTSCLGTGYTLTEAQTVIFLDNPWTKADKAQAEDRTHRIGTKGAVVIYTLMVKGTVDDHIEDIVEAKESLSDYLVDKRHLVQTKLIKKMLNIKEGKDEYEESNEEDPKIDE